VFCSGVETRQYPMRIKIHLYIRLKATMKLRVN